MNVKNKINIPFFLYYQDGQFIALICKDYWVKCKYVINETITKEYLYPEYGAKYILEHINEYNFVSMEQAIRMLSEHNFDMTLLNQHLKYVIKNQGQDVDQSLKNQRDAIFKEIFG